jgi:hypothetical protein
VVHAISLVADLRAVLKKPILGKVIGKKKFSQPTITSKMKQEMEEYMKEQQKMRRIQGQQFFRKGGRSDSKREKGEPQLELLKQKLQQPPKRQQEIQQQLRRWRRLAEEEQLQEQERQKQEWRRWQVENKQHPVEAALTSQEQEERRTERGGRIAFFADRWNTIGVKELAEVGAKADWDVETGPPPARGDFTRVEQYAGVKHQQMQQAIKEEEIAGVIEEVSEAEALFVMAAFCVPKPHSKVRLILDCRPLYVYIAERPFKMESLADLARLITRGAFVCTLDLTSAFHHVPVEPRLRKFLNFRYDGHTYRYKGLPFGLRSAPRIFSKALHVCVCAMCEAWGNTAFQYMDDLVFLHSNNE